MLLIIVAVGVGCFLLGDIQAVKGMSVMRATPHELAEAMKQDRFFSDYRRSALPVTGTIASVARGKGHLIVAFRTGSTFDFRQAEADVNRSARNASWLTNHDREDECRTKAKRSTS